MKIATQALIDKSAASNINVNEILKYRKRLRSLIQLTPAIRDLSGMNVYAQSVYSDNTLDYTAECTAMLNAAQTTLDWINANYPQTSLAGENAWAVVYEDINGDIVPYTFTPAQTAGFRTELTSLIDLTKCLEICWLCITLSLLNK